MNRSITILALSIILLLVSCNGMPDESTFQTATAQTMAAATDTPIPTNPPRPTLIPTPTLTPTPDPAALCRDVDIPENACTGVVRNADWTPYIRDIADVAMALVPAGCFQMGSTDEQVAYGQLLWTSSGISGMEPWWVEYNEQPVHEVCFDEPFWIDVTEVTYGQFANLGGQAEEPRDALSQEYPRNYITWAEAGEFCRKREAHLLTEAEWEYAARGPDGLVFPWGNDFVSDNVAWHNPGDFYNVGSFQDVISWVGAYDLSGNAAEWTNDCFARYDPINKPSTTSCTKVVIRGGSIFNIEPSGLRAASRFQMERDSREPTVGFRCGLSLGAYE